MHKTRSFAVLCALAGAFLLGTSLASTAQPDSVETTTQASDIDEDDKADDVASEIEQINQKKTGSFEFGPISIIAKPWGRFKERLSDRYNLNVGLSYKSVFQQSSNIDGSDRAAGGDFDLLDKWRLVGDEQRRAGYVGFDFEIRHTFGGQDSAELSDVIGSLWNLAGGVSGDPLIRMAQFWWEQHFWGDKAQITFGKIDQENYFSGNRMAGNFSRRFLNEAFSAKLAIAFPENGLGANFEMHPSEEFRLSVGFGNANAKRKSLSLNTIDEYEFFVAGEVEWVPHIANVGTGHYRLTIWHIDERDEAGSPSDQGIAFSMDQNIGNNVVPFLRYAYSEGKAKQTRQSVATGFGLKNPFNRKDDLLGFGIAWGRPSDRSLRDQYVTEIFYRHQLTDAIEITPGLQGILHPSNNADDNAAAVFNLRIRITL